MKDQLRDVIQRVWDGPNEKDLVSLRREYMADTYQLVGYPHIKIGYYNIKGNVFVFGDPNSEEQLEIGWAATHCRGMIESFLLETFRGNGWIWASTRDDKHHWLIRGSTLVYESFMWGPIP